MEKGGHLPDPIWISRHGQPRSRKRAATQQEAGSHAAAAACRAAAAACCAAEAACRAAEAACAAAEAAAGKFSMVRNVPPRRGKLFKNDPGIREEADIRD